MAASVTKTPERPLHDYLDAVSDSTGVRVGSALPMGTSQQENGGNFAFFSRHATRVRLELFDRPEDKIPSRQIELDSTSNRTGDVWHVWVDGIRPGQLYAYRVDGPYSPSEGQRFNFATLLLDPFATAISRLANWDFGKALGYDPCRTRAGHGVFEGRRRRGHAEMHVHPRAFQMGWGPAAQTSLVEDGDLRNPHPRIHFSFELRRTKSRHIPGTGRKNSLSQRSGCDFRGTNARPGVQRKPGDTRTVADWRATWGLLGI